MRNESKPAIEGGNPVRGKFLPLALPCIEKSEVDEVINTLKSGWITTGLKVKKFEEKFKKYIGCKYALALSSCTAALHLSLIACGIKEHDEVITSPLTFASTANVVIHQRAKPVFVDIDEKTYNINPKKIKEAITEKTRAIIPVHYAGHPCEMNRIMEIAKKNNLTVIEDAAHAIGSKYKGKKIGTIGNTTCFSFYATKVMTTGEGGMLTTDNREIFKKAFLYSLHGMDKNAWKRYTAKGSWFYEIKEAGYKYNMTDIQASLGLVQLEKLGNLIKAREKIAKKYTKALHQIPEIITPFVSEDIKHSWYIYPIQIKTGLLKIDRNKFIRALKAENIGTSVHFIPLHLQPFYKNLGYKKGDFPVTEKIYSQLISIPLFPMMTEQDVEDVINAIKKITEFYRK